MNTENLATVIHDNARTFASASAMRFQEGDAWESLSYRELGERITAVAKALLDAGVAAGDMVGIFSPNCPEWTIADFAILSVGAVSVPIYATNTAKQAAYVVTDADISFLFVGGQEQYDKVLAAQADMPELRHVVAFNDDTEFADPESADDSRQSHEPEHLRDFAAKGADLPLDAEVHARIDAAKPGDVATLIYTSGTTGEPKGVMLTHANMFHQVRALNERFSVGPGDVSLCFLPLSHAYERCWSFYVFARGAQNCYVRDPSRVAEAMVEVRPTTMVSVPRLYEKVYATILDRVQRGSDVKARIFHWAVSVGGRYQHRKHAGSPIGPLLRAEHALADRLVLKTVRDAMGGDKNVLSAGGAPLSAEIEEFFFATGLFVCQGYGLTETTAMVSCNYPGAFKFGTVGTPVSGTEVRIAASGEIQIRGGAVMVGYHGKPEQTAAAFEDGWFKTGDVGTLDDQGFLQITDRIKDLIITSQGKNIAPQHVESLLGADPFIEQIVVLGDRRKFLCALIQPDFPILERYANEHGISYKSRDDLVAAPEVRALFDERLTERSVELAGYEQVKQYALISTTFSQAGGQLTPTLKPRRTVIATQFADTIDAMYEPKS